MTPEEALRILSANAGTQFDPEVVAAFVRLHGRVPQDAFQSPDAPHEPDLDRLSRALGSAADVDAGREVRS
jgi:HD-GYP domain-containing protein (c-di-GMP phosphodiesterase class II)